MILNFFSGVGEDINPYNALSLSLYLLYSCNLNGEKRDFRSKFDFWVTKKDLKYGPFPYKSAIREEGTYPYLEVEKILDVKGALDHEIGTLMLLRFQESRINLNHPVSLSISKKRNIFYDPRTRIIWFFNNPEKNKLYVLSYN